MPRLRAQLKASAPETPERHRAGAPSPRGPATRLSKAAENYLLSFSILQEDGISPHITQLANYLRQLPLEEEVGTTLASVSGMVHRMEKEGLVSIGKGKQVSLTTEGERRAHYIVRRHRLAERMLVDILQVPLHRAEIEAHQLEHSISPELLQRIEEKLGYPETCPYGRPIPRADDYRLPTASKDLMRLSEAKKGTTHEIVRIPDEDHRLLIYMVDNSILPGQRVTVEDNAPYRGVVDLVRDGKKVSIGMDVANRIRVKKPQS